MESDSPARSPFQFSIAGGFIILTATAAVLALGNLWEERGGLYLALPVSAIPFSFVVEYALRSPARSREAVKATTVIWRLAAIAGWANTLSRKRTKGEETWGGHGPRTNVPGPCGVPVGGAHPTPCASGKASAGVLADASGCDGVSGPA